MVSKLQTTELPTAADSPRRSLPLESLQSRVERFEELARRSGRRGMPIARIDSAPSGQARAVDPVPDPVSIHRSAWIANALATSQPKRHVDISDSPLLAAIVGAFVSTHWYGYGAAPLKLAGSPSNTVNPLDLPFRAAGVPSISCTGIIERLGLGQEDCELDPDADLKAMEELKRIIAPDGSLLLVLPIGKPCVLFDSHRIYSFGQVLDCFEAFDLEEFAVIPDAGAGLVLNPDHRLADRQTCGAGCFWFRKPLTGETSPSGRS